jgi:hypothetical protein
MAFVILNSPLIDGNRLSNVHQSRRRDWWFDSAAIGPLIEPGERNAPDVEPGVHSWVRNGNTEDADGAGNGCRHVRSVATGAMHIFVYGAAFMRTRRWRRSQHRSYEKWQSGCEHRQKPNWVGHSPSLKRLNIAAQPIGERLGGAKLRAIQNRCAAPAEPASWA